MDQVFEDVQVQQNHITKLGQLTGGFLQAPEEPSFSAGIFPLLLGVKGLAQTPQQLAAVTPEQKQAQKEWALEFILRYTHKHYDAEKVAPEAQQTRSFLTRVAESFSGIDTATINIEHVAYCCVLSVTFQWEIDKELYTFPTYEGESQLAFLRAESTYADLSAHSPELPKQVHAKVLEKLADQNALDAFLQKSAYAQIAPATINYLKAPTLSQSNKIPGYEYSTDASYRLPFRTTLQRLTSGDVFRKPHQVNVTGTIRGVPDDGTCYFHTVRDLMKPVASWKTTPPNLTREFVASQIEEHINDPIVRFWLSQEALLHLCHYIALENPFQWLEDFDMGRRFVQLTQTIKRKELLQKELQSTQSTLVNLAAAGALSKTNERQLQSKIDELNAVIISLESEREKAIVAAAKKELDDVAKTKLQKWLYTKPGARTYLKEVIVGTNLWALTGSLLNTIFAYIYGLEFYLLETPEDGKLLLESKIRVSPTSQQHGIVHNRNHFMWIRDIELTSTESIAGAS